VMQREQSSSTVDIWQKNMGADAVLWNGDGKLDSLDELNQRNAAQVSNWCRPVFITLNKNLAAGLADRLT